MVFSVLRRWFNKRQIRVYLRMVQSLLFIYVCVGAFAFLFSDRLIFLPPPATYQDGPDILKLTTADGAQISALYLPNPQARYTFLYSHGNAEDLGRARPGLEALRDLGFAIFAYDYRGYGTSQGTPSEPAIYQDIDAAYRYLTNTLKLPVDRVIVYGRSVGGGPSIDLASRVPVAGLIVESTFTTAFRVVTKISLYPFDRFANIVKIARVRCPVLIIHGTADRVVPFHHGKALYQRANQPKRLVEVPGADHNDLRLVAGTVYTQALQEFARSLPQ